MKPREQLSQTQAQAKGLARWGWIKAYLEPALKYIGVTSDDFDKIFLGKDQNLRERPEDSTIFPHPIIQISGDIYEPTGDDPPEEDTSDGWWYIEWQWTPNTTDFDLDATPSPLYQWDQTYTLNTPPRYSFKPAETFSDVLAINTTSPDPGNTGWTRILVARRETGIISTYGSPTQIDCQLRGFETVTVTIV